MRKLSSRHAPRLSLLLRDHIGYTAPMTGKDAGFRIRVERDLRDKFIEVCLAQDRPAAQVLREFMRTYVEANESASQQKDR